MTTTSRLSPEHIEIVLGRAIQHGHLTRDGGAVMFHDLGFLAERIGEVASAFPPRALHTVAIKANPVLGVLRACVRAGAGLEAASLEEVHLGIAAGCPPARMVYDSPAKSTTDLEAALALGVRINADNDEELARIDQILKCRVPTSVIGLRVNPEVGEGRIGITSVAGRRGRFGLTADLERLVPLFAQYPWLCGLHVHVGSQGCPLDLLVTAAARVFQLAREINTALGRDQVRSLDLGGGLPAHYRGDLPPPPSATDYAAALRAAIKDFDQGTFELLTEFGRSLQATAGFTVTPVEYVKVVNGELLAVAHVGADLMLRTAYHPADWPYEMLAFDPSGHLRTGPMEPWTIAGPLCFAGDVIGRRIPLPRLGPGDFLAIRDTGGYTIGMWSRHCSRGMPPVLGYESEALSGFRLMRARETPADMVAFWSFGADEA